MHWFDELGESTAAAGSMVMARLAGKTLHSEKQKGGIVPPESCHQNLLGKC
jgi:hypothetical protein